CADACGVGAISLTLGDVSDRRDLPSLTDELEVIGVPGLFLAGEIGGQALVRTATAQGAAVARTVASRQATGRGDASRLGSEPAVVGARSAAAGSQRNRGTTGATRPARGEDRRPPDEPLDLLIVGTGPGGMACS